MKNVIFRSKTVALSLAFLAVSVFGLTALSGCGSGGGNSNPVNPGSTSQSLLSGTVTDATGSPIVGARVVFGNQTATSSQFGTYTIPNVVVPANVNSVVGTVHADLVIIGRQWSGQNFVEILKNEVDTSNVHIVMSPVNEQNSISGFVRDAQGNLLSGARVFASIGLTNQANGATFFKNLSSISTTTDGTGFYRLQQLPSRADYTVTASFIGRANQTINNVGVALPPASETTLSFTLNGASGANSVIPAVTGFDVQSITGPENPTRAVGISKGYAALRQYILAKSKFMSHHDAKSITRKTITRSTPSGSLIEADLFWDYDPTLTNVYGYDIEQATNVTAGSSNFLSIATLRDSLADRFSDLDFSLTPDLSYYYSVHRLDTVNFPAGGTGAMAVSPPSPIIGILPLKPISQTSPVSGASVNSNNFSFSWTPVSRATKYQILVFNEFPDLQSDTDTVNGVKTIWTGPSSTISAPATSLSYQGPALVRGATYYWAVLAQFDSTDTAFGNAFSVSALQPFVAQ